jgi:ribosome biogenesis GTPase / thiamine phosphate phosphatase
MQANPEHTSRLSHIGWREDLPAAAVWATLSGLRLARVVEQHRSGYRVDDGQNEFTVQSPASWIRAGFPPQDRAAVGDWVALAADEDLIVRCLPRFSVLKRAAAGEHYKQQLIATNVDVVLIVSGLDRDFNPRRLERYLVLTRGSGAQPVFVLTKADQSGAELAQAATELVQHLADTGAVVMTVNAKDPSTRERLSPWLHVGRTAVLVGSSGAGKSTLTNTLLGEERQRTALVRETDSRGRHTTTHRSLLRLDSGACLIDTPGMRELKLTGEESLDRSGFDLIESLATQCRFRDCKHEREPGCAVQAGLDSGEIDEGAWSNYRKLQAELAHAADVLLARQREDRGLPRGNTQKPARRRRDEKFHT